MKIKLIYLAAGNSRRFNSQRMQNTEPPQSEAENKLLYLLDEKPMFRYLFDRLVKVCQRHPEWEMIVVTQYPEIEHQVKALQENEQQGERFPVKTVISKDSYKGVAYSVKAGIRAAGDADAYAFFVADQPYFTEESVEGFLEKMEREAKVVPGCVTWNGQEGNPVWFPAKYGKELLELEGDAGGRKVFRRYREKAVFYEVSLEKELEDIDYMPEIEKMRITEGGTEKTFHVYVIENGKLQRKESLLMALGLTEQMVPRIAAVGAGGKTSLLKQLLAEYQEKGALPVLVTTTHMKKETAPYFVMEDSIEKILEVHKRRHGDRRSGCRRRQDQKPFCTGNGKDLGASCAGSCGSGWCTDASGESAGGERTGYSKADPDSPFCIWTRCHRTKDKRLLFPA